MKRPTPVIAFRITDKGVAKLRAADVLKTEQVRRALADVRRLREGQQ